MAIQACAEAELARQHDRAVRAVVQQHGGAVRAIVDFTRLHLQLAVAAALCVRDVF